jgi:hypothetical protein
MNDRDVNAVTVPRALWAGCILMIAILFGFDGLAKVLAARPALEGSIVGYPLGAALTIGIIELFPGDSTTAAPLSSRGVVHRLPAAPSPPPGMRSTVHPRAVSDPRRRPDWGVVPARRSPARADPPVLRACRLFEIASRDAGARQRARPWSRASWRRRSW